MDNPAKLNALTPAMLSELERLCGVIEADAQVLGVILTGQGERFFCAGADINAWADLPPDQFSRQWIRGGHRIFDSLHGWQSRQLPP